MPGEDLDRMWSMDISKEAKDTLVENMYLIIAIMSTTERFGECKVHKSLIYSKAQQSFVFDSLRVLLFISVWQ